MRRILMFILLVSGSINAQNDSLSCIKDSLNFIQNTSGLSAFLKATNQFKKGELPKIRVVHLGDSHVQAGFFSEPIRNDLQLQFGNAGRGIVFPYQAAGTNGPSDYNFGSAQAWKSKRNCINKSSLPTGISGHTIYSKQRSARLNFKARNRLDIGTPNRIVLYHASLADSNFSYVLSDSLGNEIAELDKNKSSDMRSEFTILKPVSTWRVLHDTIAKTGSSSTLFGVSLENESKGALVHTIGVNGAEYQHYLHSEFFIKQLAELEAELIIISLGTNEAYNSGLFDSLAFELHVDSFLTKVQTSLPNASIIITTPPGIGQAVRVSGRRKRKSYRYIENKNIPIVCSVLHKQAIKHNAAIWDFYQIMGGHDAMNIWAAKGLTDKRRIHFSRKGYLIQGSLLTKAIHNEIKQFQQKND